MTPQIIFGLDEMKLIGVNRSPFTRRVAITLKIYGVPFEQVPLSGFGNRIDVRTTNPLGRIPALMLDDGEMLIDSAAIVDHLDEVYGRAHALVPASGPDRRVILKWTAVAMGMCDKGLQAAYERNHRPSEKVHQPWIDDCIAQATNALRAIDTTIATDAQYILFGRLTHADVAAYVAVRLARSIGIDVRDMARLTTLAARLADEPAFKSTESENG